MLVSLDLSGLEWRVLTLLSGDATAIKEINSGADIHALNQAELQLPTRLIAKKFLFRTIYRGSGYAFSKDNEFKHVSVDPKFWDKKNEGFFAKYWEVDKCHQRWKSQVMNGQRIIGPSGREWKIDPRNDGEIPWTTLTNYPVQGTGADLMAIVRVSLRNRLKTGKLKSLLINTVHDSVIADCPKEEVDEVIKLMHDSCKALGPNMKKLWNVESPIPFPGECKIGTNLKDMVKV
jgi:DNA polymerase-1